ncbi:MAG: phenylalanine--tRNA ligase subunit beta [Pygmaiobacter massiliensis]|nr:phenylalanine--tRNA ligase subunit beta [Pygmaiobacter massiliensis]
MKVPFSWLKEFVDIDITAQELEKKLFDCGFEVEELIDLSAPISRVVVGQITHLEKQEGTDHLYLCRVDCGEYGHDLGITTGAPNIFEGAKVPVALDGATLPGGITIHKRVMHGIESNGMMCSGEELGINNDWYEGAETYGLLILDPDTPLGEDICKVVGLDDYIFDISITANRPDCQSILGMAREVAAILNRPVKMPATDYTVNAEGDAAISVRVEAPDLCPRYLAHYVRNIRPAPSPRWLKRHLALAGLRSINNVVDITNHTLLEIGQPMHAFDLAKVKDRSIVVRRAKPGETIVTLDEKEFNLSESNLVICDSEKPVCIAGVMGGLNSGIADDSKELLFECANFARDSIRKTSRSLGQSSDSSLRYEKGVDEYSTELGLARALHLIQQLDCGDVTDTHFDCMAGGPRVRKVLTVTPEKINGVLGIQVPEDTMKEILSRLDFEVQDNQGVWTVSVPRYREDVEGYPDLAEEVIREYGYDHIVPTLLKTAAVTNGGLTPSQKNQLKLKRLLAAQGFFEASTMAFYSTAELDMLHLPEKAPQRKAIRLLNPITEHLSIMRTILAPSMLNVIVENLKRGNNEGRLFELSNIYLPHELPVTQAPEERLTLSLGAFGPKEDFFTLKGAVQAIAQAFDLDFTYERGEVSWLHPGITATVSCEGRVLGVLGKLSNEITGELKIAKDEKTNQNIYLAELDYVALSECFKTGYRYKPLPVFAQTKRDLALVCEETVSCGAIEEVIRSASPLVSETRLFDIYRGEKLGAEKKSMAFTITFAQDDREIPAQEVENAVQNILAALKEELQIEMR